jgi:site-specific DNA-cytosine methylase
LRIGSLFSGIEGFGLGFEQAGAEIIWQVEQDKFCNAVLETHWPSVQRFTDVCRVGKANLAPVDCITAGVPCQDVSIAGQRKGLAGKRTGLFYQFARILRELRPAWFVFENVPGLFSSNQGRDFAEVLRVLMVECGYGVSWRVLDSRYFNVAQRRERVFIVGCFGKPCPAEILFESESGKGNFTESGASRQDIAVSLTSGSGVAGNDPGRRCEDDFNIRPCYWDGSQLADTLDVSMLGKQQAMPDKRRDAEFSPAFIYYKCREFDKSLDQGDCGSTGRSVVHVLNQFCAALRSDEPYTPGDFSTPPTDAQLAEALTYKAGSYHRVANVEDMKTCLVSGYIFGIGFTVYESFESIKSDGLWTPDTTENVLGGHETTVVGYDDSVNGGSFKVRNSWGPTWGASGNFWLRYSDAGNPDVLQDAWMIHLGRAWS